jgi:hypothetical protein
VEGEDIPIVGQADKRPHTRWPQPHAQLHDGVARGGQVSSSVSSA